MTTVDSAETDANYVRDLPSDATAPSEARRSVAETLTRWELSQYVDEAQLVASELVTNAVRHGAPQVTLALSLTFQTLRMDVGDGSGVEPVSAPCEIDEDAEGGRGMSIVEAVSDDHGVDQVPHDGKRVFALWRLKDEAGRGGPARSGSLNGLVRSASVQLAMRL